MKRLAIFIQVLIVLTGIAALAFMLVEPHLEGRNVNATFFEIYFKDLFLAYAYTASIPFFVLLYKSYKVMDYAADNKLFTPEALKAVRTIKYCALSMIGFAAVGVIIIMLNESDDRAGGVFIGFLISFSSFIIAAAAARIGMILKKTMEGNSTDK